jgi:hypothetical protein
MLASLHWAILQSPKDAFRKASSQLEERLEDATGATKAVIAATLEHRHARTFEVEPEIARLAALRVALLGSRNEIILTARGDGRISGGAEGTCAVHSCVERKC